MTKEQLTKFAQNYQLKTIKDPDKNKFWIIAFSTLIPTFVAMIFSVTAVWIPGICLSCIAILVSIFAEKIGDVEVLNNVGLLFNLSLFFPFALFLKHLYKTFFPYYHNVCPFIFFEEIYENTHCYV